jgi:hypothetical protein
MKLVKIIKPIRFKTSSGVLLHKPGDLISLTDVEFKFLVKQRVMELGFLQPIFSESKSNTREEIMALVSQNIRRCFLCKWIIEGYRLSGKLVDKCHTYLGEALFPVESQLQHLALEFKIPLDEIKQSIDVRLIQR